MIKKVFLFLMLVSISGNVCAQNGIVWNHKRIKYVKERYNKSDTEYVKLINKLFNRANDVMKKKDFPSVTMKENKYVAESLNDYVSMATYYWPNPDTEDGLPYIGKDGEVNPETKTAIPDQVKFYDLCERIKTLGLASYFSRDSAYGNRANKLLRVWFLNPKTKMNPHLNHSQFIKGKNTGRTVGLIDGRFLVDVMDGTQLLKKQGYISNRDYQAIKSWFREYQTWLLTSPIGEKGAKLKNNIGTAYFLQLVAIKSFLEDRSGLEDLVAGGQLKGLLAKQFKDTGDQPLELKRKSPIVYSVANLKYWAMINNILAPYGIDPFGNYNPIIMRGLKELEGKLTKKSTFRYIKASLGEKKSISSRSTLREDKLNTSTWADVVNSITFQ